MKAWQALVQPILSTAPINLSVSSKATGRHVGEILRFVNVDIPVFVFHLAHDVVPMGWVLDNIHIIMRARKVGERWANVTRSLKRWEQEKK